MGILATYSDLATVASPKPSLGACLQYQSVGLCRKSQSWSYFVSYLVFSSTFTPPVTWDSMLCCMNFQPCAPTTFPSSFWLLQPLSHAVTSASILS